MKSAVAPPYKRAVRALRFTILGLELIVVLLSLLSAYTLYSAFSATIQSGEQALLGVEQTVDPETGDWLLTLNGRPTNQGFLDVTFRAKARALTLTNETVAAGENSTRVPPGGRGAFTITLRLPRELVQQGRGIFEVELHVRTLMDLVGFSVNMRVRGEG